MHESEKGKWSRSIVSTLSDPMDCSPPGSSVHRIFQPRVLEWAAIAFSTANRWDAPKSATAAAALVNRRGKFFSMTTPDCTSHNQHFKSWTNQALKFCLLHTWLPVNWLLLLQASRKLFAGKILPEPAGGRKCFPRVCQILKQGFLHYRNKPTYFALAKMCWLHNGSYFD